MKFNGIQAPAGEGLILEVHADLIQPTLPFVDALEAHGFEDDPFTVFHPAGYTKHMTGRQRVLPQDVRGLLTETNSSLARIIADWKDEVGFYFEIELVRGTTRFSGEQPRTIGQLDCFEFLGTGRLGGAKADVHVEFVSGTVTDEVRRYLAEKLFYWVATPITKHFGSEEIATLQTKEYEQAAWVYQALCQKPLPGCTGFHLEQKLGMSASRANLPMPEVIGVRQK